MYDYLFEAKTLTAVAALGCTWLASSLAGAPRLWWRGIGFSFVPMLAAAFFIVAPTGPSASNALDLFGCFLLEFTVLCLFYILLKALYSEVRRAGDEDVARLLKATLVLQVAVAVPAITSEGFGIFSEGSRIDYLYAGSIAKYFTYAGTLVMFAQAPLIAQRLSSRRGLGALDSVVILTTLAVSVLAGSKGAVFLWIGAMLALVDYRRARPSWRAVALAALLLAAALWTSWFVVSEFLGLSSGEFAELIVNRFFLSNDARALALDYRNGFTPDAGLLAESFRSLSAFFGRPPENPPLGVLLYADLFGFESSNGANTSLTALLLFYSQSGYAVFPALIAALGGAVLAWLFGVVGRAMGLSACRMVVFAIALVTLQQYSQDFLAFQVVVPLDVLSIVCVWLYDRSQSRARRRPLPRRADVAPA